MSTEFKVVFEGRIPARVATHLNVALQATALNVISAYFPDPDGPEVPPRGPGGPVEGGTVVEALVLPPSFRGIIFDPNLAVRPSLAE